MTYFCSGCTFPGELWPAGRFLCDRCAGDQDRLNTDARTHRHPESTDPESLALAKERIEHARALVRHLTPREELALTLHVRDGLVLRDVARKLRVSTGRAGELARQALGKVRSGMSRYEADLPPVVHDAPSFIRRAGLGREAASIRSAVAHKVSAWAGAATVACRRVDGSWRVQWTTMCRRRDGHVEPVCGHHVPFEWTLDPCADASAVLAIVDDWIEAVTAGPLKAMVLLRVDPIAQTRPEPPRGEPAGWRSSPAPRSPAPTSPPAPPSA